MTQRHDTARDPREALRIGLSKLYELRLVEIRQFAYAADGKQLAPASTGLLDLELGTADIEMAPNAGVRTLLVRPPTSYARGEDGDWVKFSVEEVTGEAEAPVDYVLLLLRSDAVEAASWHKDALRISIDRRRALREVAPGTTAPAFMSGQDREIEASVRLDGNGLLVGVTFVGESGEQFAVELSCAPSTARLRPVPCTSG